MNNAVSKLWLEGRLIAFLVVVFATLAPVVNAQDTAQSEREAMYERYLEFPSYVKGGSIEPHWMADGSSFWYEEGAPDNTLIWKVDPKANTKTQFFDAVRIREALTPLLSHEPPSQGLPFAEFAFVDESETAVKFTVEEKEFILQLDTYALAQSSAVTKEDASLPNPKTGEVPSPDGSWFVSVKDHDLWLRSATNDSTVRLTTDGMEDYDWGHADYYDWGKVPWACWSPQSSKIAVTKLDVRKVEKIPVVHWLTSPAQVEWVPYPRAGTPLPQSELFIVDITSKRNTLVDIGDEPDQIIRILGWRTDGSELLIHRVDRLFKKLDVLAVEPKTGATRVIVTENQKTFVPGWRDNLFTLLGDGRRFIWVSERDGWNHLYLYNLDGTLLRRLSEGSWPVIRVVSVDEKNGWVYFTAHGDQQRPYDTHLYRVSLDGTGFVRLTEATGEHLIQFSPSKQFFITTHSTVARPPMVELRRADGMLLKVLSKANIDALVKDLKWEPPEEFVVKSTDGKTELYGVLYKPYDFDPKKKYPVAERNIYTGRPVVPRTFSTGRDWKSRMGRRAQALAQLGFVTFLVDSRGTKGRGKAFEDAPYGSAEHVTVADHVATLKQLAETRSYLDLTRVGIVGHSFGGYDVLRAMLLYPKVYHVGIAISPCAEPLYQLHDDFELQLGMPQRNDLAWEDASNVQLADNLRGKLLLIHGSSDVITPLSHTMRMVDAFVRAGKPVDMLILPEDPHTFTVATRPYVFDAVYLYLQEHLKP